MEKKTVIASFALFALALSMAATPALAISGEQTLVFNKTSDGGSCIFKCPKASNGCTWAATTKYGKTMTTTGNPLSVNIKAGSTLYVWQPSIVTCTLWKYV